MIAVVVLAILMLLVVVDLCVIAGWTADSRDSEHRLWPLTDEPALNPIAAPAARATRRPS